MQRKQGDTAQSLQPSTSVVDAPGHDFIAQSLQPPHEHNITAHKDEPAASKHEDKLAAPKHEDKLGAPKPTASCSDEDFLFAAEPTVQKAAAVNIRGGDASWALKGAPEASTLPPALARATDAVEPEVHRVCPTDAGSFTRGHATLSIIRQAPSAIRRNAPPRLLAITL